MVVSVESNQIDNLKFHVIQIASSMIHQISSSNTIQSLDNDQSVFPDAVSNHHLIEILSMLNSDVFIHYCQTLFKWLSEPKNGYLDHPFTLDSYTNFCIRNGHNDSVFYDTIAKKQLADGSIPIYTALIRGGDFFSTLWAIKILTKYNSEFFSETIEKGIEYLLEKKDISARTSSQRGFLLYVLIHYGNAKFQKEIELLAQEIIAVGKEISFNGNVIDLINDVYILEDLQEYYYYSQSDEAGSIIESKLIDLFDLSSEKELPKAFSKHNGTIPESPFYQLLLKSAKIAVNFLTHNGEERLGFEINAYLHGEYRKSRYERLALSLNLKEYKKQYDGIEYKFRRYDDALKLMWEKTDSEYERSIFLMMPFKSDLNTRALTKYIRKTSEELGIKVFRVDDEHRKPYDTLWDNIVLNMLGCKYGIAVYISDKHIDKLTDEPKFFHNPNVALEFGFMKSRGRKVLILKDKDSIIPSDLQGFIWRPFDIRNPDTSVSGPVGEWINEYLLSDDSQ